MCGQDDVRQGCVSKIMSVSVMVCNKRVCVCVWNMVHDKVVCDEVVFAKDGVCVCDKLVCDKDVIQRCVLKMVCDNEECSRRCVTKSRPSAISTTPATQSEGRCHQVPHLPRKRPRQPRCQTGPKRVSRASPVP